jgi:hypothetical protein
VFLTFVIDGEAGFLQGLEIPANGPGGDAGVFGQFVDRHARACRFNLPENLPLPDDFSVAQPVCPRSG